MIKQFNKILIGLVLVGTFFFNNVAFGAIGIGQTLEQAIDEGTNNISVTISGTNKLLMVSIATDTAAANSITSVKYNGDSFTQLAKIDNNSTYLSSWVYYLVNPDDGTNNLEIILDTGVKAYFSETSFTGVNQNNPFGASGNNKSDNGSSPSITFTTQNSNSYIYDSLALNNKPTTGTVGANQTGLTDGVSSSPTYMRGLTSYEITTTPGSYNMSWALSGTTAYAYYATEIKEPVSGPVNVKTILGTAVASVKTRIGLAWGSVKTLLGLN